MGELSVLAAQVGDHPVDAADPKPFLGKEAFDLAAFPIVPGASAGAVGLPYISEDPLEALSAEDSFEEPDGVVPDYHPLSPGFELGFQIVRGGVGSVQLDERRLDKANRGFGHLVHGFLEREGRAVAARGAVYFYGGKVPGLDPEDQAGPGKMGIPGNLEMHAFQAIGRAAP
jgi:hypothetical protein